MSWGEMVEMRREDEIGSVTGVGSRDTYGGG